MKTEVVNVTPAKAKKWLDAAQDFKNRHVSPRHVETLASAILNDQWKLNGETIKFNNGTVIDGQHRLLACVKADKSFNTYVAYDVPTDVFTTIDTGRRRQQSDVLSMLDVANAHTVASAIQWITRIKQGNTRVRLNNTEVVRLLDEYSGLSNGYAIAQALSVRKLITRGVALALWYLFNEQNPERAAYFFEKLTTGAALAKSSPILRLRERLIAIERGGISRLLEIVALTIKAWNLYGANKPCAQLQWRENEAFPKII